MSTIVAAALGPALVRIFFGFTQGVSSATFLAMGLSVGLHLAAMILAQAACTFAMLLATALRRWKMPQSAGGAAPRESAIWARPAS